MCSAGVTPGPGLGTTVLGGTVTFFSWPVGGAIHKLFKYPQVMVVKIPSFISIAQNVLKNGAHAMFGVLKNYILFRNLAITRNVLAHLTKASSTALNKWHYTHASHTSPCAHTHTHTLHDDEGKSIHLCVSATLEWLGLTQ